MPPFIHVTPIWNTNYWHCANLQLTRGALTVILRLTDCSTLIELPQGSGAPWVETCSQLHAAVDSLPVDVAPQAREFVASCMQKEYGLPVNWPKLAVEFVFPISEDRSPTS
jgi:hypothetical protein